MWSWAVMESVNGYGDVNGVSVALETFTLYQVESLPAKSSRLQVEALNSGTY